MEIMDLSALRPEERVRQQFIQFMKSLGFPEAFLVIEKSLNELESLSIDQNLPQRRIDILAYAKFDTNLRPLVLVECKASKLDQAALTQVLGYNHFIGAPFIVLVAKSGYCVFNCITQSWIEGLTSYDELCLQARNFFNSSTGLSGKAF
jgi:hypothetical protein